MKSYTDIEQSKKLSEILLLESADMRYHTISQYNQYPCDEIVYTINFGKPSGIDIPCWSLAALMDVLDRGALFITPQGWACQSYINLKAITSDHHSNPIDACYEIILRLHELKML